MDNVIVSTHAIDQARSRVWSWGNKPNEEIIHRLARVVNYGKRIRRCASGIAQTWEMEYQGVYIVVTPDRCTRKVVIKTCLGDHTYRQWLAKKRKNELIRIGNYDFGGRKKARKVAR